MSTTLSSLVSTLRNNGRLYTSYVELQYSRVFTMFFPSKIDTDDVMIYYPGGPGISGTSHVLNVFSPLVLRNGDVCVNMGVYDITSKYNLIYMDIGGDIGYSRSKDNNVVHGDNVYTQEMYSCIRTLIHRHMNDRCNIYMFGFSYAGKVLPMVARLLIDGGYTVRKVSLFSGYTDPIDQEINPINEYLLYNGLISNSDYDRLEKMTNSIERRLRTSTIDRSIQQIYTSTMNTIWRLTGVNTYNIIEGSDVEESLDDEMNDTEVMKSIGSIYPYNEYSQLYDPSTYDGFLVSAIQHVKYIVDNGVHVVYVMGSMDGAVLAKGTKDMISKAFSIDMDEQIWRYNGIHIGKIATHGNIGYGIVTGTGHSMDSSYGRMAFAHTIYRDTLIP